MTPEENILSRVEKAKKPNVPEGFFESFFDRVMNEIESESESSFLNTLEKSDKPALGQDYFKNFSEQLAAEVTEHKTEPKIKKMARVRTLYWLSGAAAAILLLFLFLPSNTDNVETLASEVVITEADEELLAFVSEEDIIDYLVESSELETDEGTEEDEFYYDELESNLYEYFNEL